MGDLSKYLSLLEAARKLGISKSRIEQYVRDGRLKVQWLAGRRIVLRSDVDHLGSIPRVRGRPKKPSDHNSSPKRKS